MRPYSHPPRLTISAILGMILVLVTTTVPSHSQPSIPASDKPLQFEGRIAQSGVITTSQDPIPADLAGVKMLQDRLGITHQLETKSLSSINRLARASSESEDLNQVEYYLHYSRGIHTDVLGMHVLHDSVVLQDPDDSNRTWTVRRDAFDRLGIQLQADEPEAEQSEPILRATKSASSLVLPTPHVESEVVLDSKTRRTRFKINYPDFTRVVGNETFHVRLPKGFDPDSLAGVLVHISPTPSGKIHECYESACDELGLIAIGVDNNGNQRDITDRLQNHLDSIETLAQHAAIDRERIYLTGMSGGGRCSSLLLLAFPDLFAGAVPIVGLDTYHNAPTGREDQYWPRRLAKPAGRWIRMLKDRRIRSITGSADFNEPEMRIRTELLQQDGFQAQLDTIQGMGHAYPTAKHFKAALVWVDEPRRDAIEEARADAIETLADTKDKYIDTPAVRRRLIEIMTSMPYTDLAWQAADRLGYSREN
jgi:dienelactone hydrolase